MVSGKLFLPRYITSLTIGQLATYKPIKGSSLVSICETDVTSYDLRRNLRFIGVPFRKNKYGGHEKPKRYTMHEYGAGEYDYGDDVNGMCISFSINFRIIYQAFVINNNKVFFELLI